MGPHRGACGCRHAGIGGGRHGSGIRPSSRMHRSSLAPAAAGVTPGTAAGQGHSARHQTARVGPAARAPSQAAAKGL
eukprot:5205222-Lingulodinium_polyedra.AAC.1